MRSFLKQSIAALILTSFLTIVFFSSAMMMRSSDGQMAGDCPFSTAAASPCPQGIAAAAVHHISEYETFLNVPVSPSAVISVLGALFALAAAIVIYFTLPLREPPTVGCFSHDSKPADLFNRKITRWLSLFENSPSFI